MLFRSRSSFLLSSITLVAFLAGCPGPATTSHQALIGPGGGELAIPSGTGTGARVTVPMSAVAEPTTFTASATDGATGLPAGARAVGPTITFGPEGASFVVAVAIEIPATEEPDRLLTRPHGASSWTVVTGAEWVASTGVMMANVSHFSDFIPVVDDTAMEDAGMGDAAEMCPFAPETEGACSDGSDRDCDGLIDCDDTADCGGRARCISQVCDPLAATDGCAAGQHCALTGPDMHPQLPAAACVPNGSAAEGDACTAQSDCGPGLSCTRSLGQVTASGPELIFSTSLGAAVPDQACRRICPDANDWSAATCPGGQLCHAILQTDATGGTTSDGSLLFSGYGACAAPRTP